MNHNVNIVDPPEEIDTSRLQEFCGEVLNALVTDPVEVSIAFFDDEAMTELNAQFRGKEVPTDVLSFPLDEPPVDGIHYFGDIAISHDTAQVQAEELGHDLWTEIVQLVLHGMLHLKGYDHEYDEGDMDELELKLRKEIAANYCP